MADEAMIIESLRAQVEELGDLAYSAPEQVGQAMTVLVDMIETRGKALLALEKSIEQLRVQVNRLLKGRVDQDD